MKRAEHYAGIGVIAIALAIVLSWQSHGIQARSAKSAAPAAHDGGAGFRQLEIGQVRTCVAPRPGQVTRPANVLVDALAHSGAGPGLACVIATSAGTTTRQEPLGP